MLRRAKDSGKDGKKGKDKKDKKSKAAEQKQKPTAADDFSVSCWFLVKKIDKQKNSYPGQPGLVNRFRAEITAPLYCSLYAMLCFAVDFASVRVPESASDGLESPAALR